MAERKVDYDKLIDLIAQKKRPSEIARTFRVNPSTITRQIQRLRHHAPKVMVLEKSEKYAEVQSTFIDQYSEGIESLFKLKRALHKYMYEGDRKTFIEMQHKMESKSVEQGEPGDTDQRKQKGKGGGRKSRIEQKVERFDFRVDPKALLVQVDRAIADYLRLKIEFWYACMDAEKIIPFLRDVTAIIGSASPELKHEIEETLKRHQLIRSIITFSADTKGTGGDPGHGPKDGN